MPKITVHGGPTNAAGDDNVRSPDEHGEIVTVGESEPEHVTLPVGAAVVARAETGETLDGSFESLPEVVEDDTSEHVSEPDYDAWTAKELRTELGDRELPTSGNRAEMIARLREADNNSDKS